MDQSEHTLTQVGAIIVEGNSGLAGFQPNVTVVATWIFSLYDFNGQRMDKVSCCIWIVGRLTSIMMPHHNKWATKICPSPHLSIKTLLHETVPRVYRLNFYHTHSRKACTLSYTTHHYGDRAWIANETVQSWAELENVYLQVRFCKWIPKGFEQSMNSINRVLHFIPRQCSCARLEKGLNTNFDSHKKDKCLFFSANPPAVYHCIWWERVVCHSTIQ